MTWKGANRQADVVKRRKATHNLELHSLALELDSPNLEVHANGADVALRVGVVRKPEQQARLCIPQTTGA